MVQLGLKGKWLQTLGSGEAVVRIERLDDLLAEQRTALTSSAPQNLTVPVARPLDVGHLQVSGRRGFGEKGFFIFFNSCLLCPIFISSFFLIFSAVLYSSIAFSFLVSFLLPSFLLYFLVLVLLF